MADTVRDIDVIKVIDQAPIAPMQIRVMILCGLVALLDGFDAQSIAFVATAMTHDLQMDISRLGPIFGAGTLGLALGALALPPFADRYGRKRLIIASVTLFGIFSLATAWANSFGSIFVLRLLTGLGVGAAVPIFVPLLAEYAPHRMRAGIITLVTCAWPLGAVVGGLVSSHMIPLWGWRSVFYLGGLLPLVLAAVLTMALPESIRFLVARAQYRTQAIRLLRKITPRLTIMPEARLLLLEERPAGFLVRHLFTGGRALTTILLWVPFFMNFLVLFFMFNWLPAVMQQAGLPPERALLATVLFNLGGVIGCLFSGRLMDRFGQYTVLGVAYAAAAVLVGSIGLLGSAVTLIMVVVFLSGLCAVAAQACGNALAASLYPTTIRSTGVGWAYGIGRIGSIVGPVLGGILLSLHWPLSDLFMVAGLPLLVAALAMPLLRSVTGNRQPTETIFAGIGSHE